MLAKVGSPCIILVTIFSYLICVAPHHHSGDYFFIFNLCRHHAILLVTTFFCISYLHCTVHLSGLHFIFNMRSTMGFFPNYLFIYELHSTVCLFSDSDLICVFHLSFWWLKFDLRRVVPSIRSYPYYFSFSMGSFHQFELSYLIFIF